MILVPLGADRRAAVEAAMRNTLHPISAIAKETGVSAATIQSWNRRFRWRPLMPGYCPSRWSVRRRAAVARLYRQPWLDIADLAVALGVPRHRTETLFAECGLTGRVPGEVAGAPGPDTDPRRLRAALRSHIARQIARFDMALDAEDDGDPKTFDSARVLRDLGGLKRLLDEADHDERTRTGPAGTESDTRARDGTQGGDPGSAGADHDIQDNDIPDNDLPALRAEIARRAAALCDERPDAGPAGEPAAPPDPGARD
jgi:hypothetical protein